MLSSDGKVAEQGTYQELSNKPDGAFTKLMEWQMSGSDMPGALSQPQQQQQVQGAPEPGVKEGEELMLDVEEGDSAIEEGEQPGEDVRGEKQGSAEKVLEKAEPGLKES